MAADLDHPGTMLEMAGLVARDMGTYRCMNSNCGMFAERLKDRIRANGAHRGFKDKTDKA